MKEAHFIFSIWPWSQIRRRVNFLKLRERYLSRTAKSLESVARLTNINNNKYELEELEEIVKAITRMMYETIDQFPSEDKISWYLLAELEHYEFLRIKDPDTFNSLSERVKRLVQENTDSKNRDLNIKTAEHLVEEMKSELNKTNLRIDALYELINRSLIKNS